MKKLKLVRFIHAKHETQGLLMWDVPGKDVGFLCFTLEDEYRAEKVKHHTRIPEGIYKLELRRYGGFHARYQERYGSDWHKGMLEVLDVPGFTDILVHCGNTDEDTSGCILVGDSLSPASWVRVEMRTNVCTLKCAMCSFVGRSSARSKRAVITA